MTDDFPDHRPNVGVVLFNAEGLTWIGRRADMRAGRRWQWPQGGIDPGEDAEAAARRELWEETGVRSADFLARTESWIAYDFPPGVLERDRQQGRQPWLGQKQLWFAFRLTGPESEVDLTVQGEPEFDRWRWEHLEKVVNFAAPFKAGVYRRVTEAFRLFAAA